MVDFKVLTNGIQKAFSGMGNNPKFQTQNQGNKANTDTNRVRKATKSNATSATGGNIFGKFIG